MHPFTSVSNPPSTILNNISLVFRSRAFSWVECSFFSCSLSACLHMTLISCCCCCYRLMYSKLLLRLFVKSPHIFLLFLRVLLESIEDRIRKTIILPLLIQVPRWEIWGELFHVLHILTSTQHRVMLGDSANGHTFWSPVTFAGSEVMGGLLTRVFTTLLILLLLLLQEGWMQRPELLKGNMDCRLKKNPFLWTADVMQCKTCSTLRWRGGNSYCIIFSTLLLRCDLLVN